MRSLQRNPLVKGKEINAILGHCHALGINTWSLMSPYRKMALSISIFNMEGSVFPSDQRFPRLLLTTFACVVLLGTIAHFTVPGSPIELAGSFFGIVSASTIVRLAIEDLVLSRDAVEIVGLLDGLFGYVSGAKSSETGVERL